MLGSRVDARGNGIVVHGGRDSLTPVLVVDLDVVDLPGLVELVSLPPHPADMFATNPRLDLVHPRSRPVRSADTEVADTVLAELLRLKVVRGNHVSTGPSRT